MRTTFYIHIGVHKTGTKSIQLTLSENRKTLLRHGINYLEGDPNHGPVLISLLSDRPHRDTRNIRRRVDTPEKAASYNASVKHKIAKALARNRSPKFVISGEGLSPRPAREIDRLKQMLAPYAAAYRIIVYVRDPYEYANSASLQRLKTGGVLDMPDQQFPLPKYRRKLENWITIFGRENVDIRVFQPKRFIGGDLISDFLVAIGEPAELAKSLEIERANQSMSHEAAIVLSEANRAIPENIDGRFNPGRAFDFHIHVANIEGEKFAIDPEKYLKHEAEALADIQYLNEIIGEPAFGRTKPRPASSPRWSDATVFSIKKEVLRMSRVLRRLERRHFYLPRVEWPVLPPELKWLQDAYDRKPLVQNTQSREPAPEFNEATIRAVGCFLHDITLAIQHRKAERDAFSGSLLIWISRRLAENYYREVVRLNPRNARGQYRLSQAHLLRGHFVAARDAAKTAVELAPQRVLFRGWLRVVSAAERWFYKPPPPSPEAAQRKRPRQRLSFEERKERQRARRRG